jgi:hypothetical protein
MAELQLVLLRPDVRLHARKGKPAPKRVRIRSRTSPRLRDWLVRTSRVHAHLCTVVRLYANPYSAGGHSLAGDNYAERAASGDRTILHDALAQCRDELDVLLGEVQSVMDGAPPTDAEPGSQDKVNVMELRASRGESIFIDGDRKR